MTIYKNRYRANKDRHSNEKIVRVDGGYTIMSVDQYHIWKAQK